jgi:acyl carrier protein
VIKGEHSWLPVFFPVFYPGLKVAMGDRIEGQSQVLDNGTLTPDYRVHGELRHLASGKATSFDYTSHHRRQCSEHAPFFQALLSAAPAQGPSRPTQGTSGRQHLITELRHYLRQRLPDYMVPSAFVLLKAFPLTSSGKVDVRGLPDPDQEHDDREVDFVSPRNRLESAIAKVWQEVLGVKRVGVHDNFFDLGGHSLMIIRLQSRLHRQLDVEVSLTDLFQFPTVSSLASALAASAAVAQPEVGPSAALTANHQSGG